MTADKDWRTRVCRLRRVAFGILLVHLPGLPSTGKADAVAQVIAEHSVEKYPGIHVYLHQIVRIRQPR